MDAPTTVTPGVRRLSVNLDDDDVALFDDLWPVPHGVALHCYLVEGDRRVLVDPWDAGGFGPEEVGVDLADLGLGWADVTAVAFTRPPKADFLDRLRVWAPAVESWGTPDQGTRHDLGQGMVLEAQAGLWFVPGPGVALTGDGYAGLGWVEDPWVEDLDEASARHFEDEALRWFASRPLVPPLPEGTRIVAPAHGCLWRNPDAAVARAQRFQAWAGGPALDEVTVVWPSGPGFDPAVDALVGGVLDAGAGLNLFRVPEDDVTALAAGARRASLVVVAPGLGTDFLAGLTKDLWIPEATLGPPGLRTELARRLDEL